MRVELELDGAEPITGLLHDPSRGASRFCGWLELMSLLEATAAKGASEGAPDARRPRAPS